MTIKYLENGHVWIIKDVETITPTENGAKLALEHAFTRARGNSSTILTSQLLSIIEDKIERKIEE